ncbi:MAG: hypothetical protein V5A84_00825 [Planctomycetota bacterium]
MMQGQEQKLAETDWNVLIILDACRVDYFRPLCHGSAEAVRSPAPCTRHWIRVMLREGLLDGATYVNANPVVQDVVTKRDDVPLDVHYFRRGEDGTVYPEPLTNWLLDMARESGQPEWLVVHYLQPHAPLIGDWDEARRHWPDGAGEPDNRPYAANLWRVWLQACRLAAELSGRVVITADHGEMLGEEGGRRGHECSWDHPVLYRVPWLEYDGNRLPDTAGAGWQDDEDEPGEDEIQERMRKLGYIT